MQQMPPRIHANTHINDDLCLIEEDFTPQKTTRSTLYQMQSQKFRRHSKQASGAIGATSQSRQLQKAASAANLAPHEVDYLAEAKKRKQEEKARREKTLRKLKATMVPKPLNVEEMKVV